MVFEITSADWDLALQYFAGKEDGSKFDKFLPYPETDEIKHESERKHSFVKIDGVIYALSNSETFEPCNGGEALVKQGMTRAGKVFAIKIEFGDYKDLTSTTCKIARRHGLFIAQAVRNEPDMTIKIADDLGNDKKLTGDDKRYKTLTGDKKRYTVMEWLGETLFDVIADDSWTDIPSITKDLIALRTCLCVRKLHQSGTLHCDIKAENLTIIFKEIDVSIAAIDMDYAYELGDQTYVIGVPRGTPGYVAPEIISEKRFSPLSDTWALAIVLLFQMNIVEVDLNELNEAYFLACEETFDVIPQTLIEPLTWLKDKGIELEAPLHNLFAAMLASDYQQRKNADGMIQYLCKRILKDQSLPKALRADVEAIELDIRLQAVVAIIAPQPSTSVGDSDAVEALLMLSSSLPASQARHFPAVSSLEEKSRLKYTPG